MKKHFAIEITDTSFTFDRKTDQIAAEADLDGFYVLRTSVPADTLPTDDVVRAYKGLEEVERAFGTFKGPELRDPPDPPPPRETASARTSCSACSPTTSPGTSAQPGRRCCSKTSTRQPPPTPSPRPPAPPAAQHKAQTKRTTTGEPCHSYKSLLTELATLTQQHDPPPRHARDLRQTHRTHPTTGPRARPRRPRARHRVVTTTTPNQTPNPMRQAKSPHTRQRELRPSRSGRSASSARSIVGPGGSSGAWTATSSSAPFPHTPHEDVV